jgi:hypothetical protein
LSETPAQRQEAYKAEAERMAADWVAAQLSTKPVDESKVEARLRQVYQGAGITPPRTIWLDGPLQLVLLVLARTLVRDPETRVWDSIHIQAPEQGISRYIRDDAGDDLHDTIRGRVWNRVGLAIRELVWGSVRERVEANQWTKSGQSGEASLWAEAWHDVHEWCGDEDADDWERPSNWYAEMVQERVGNSLWLHCASDRSTNIRYAVEEGVRASVAAYEAAPELAVAHFYTLTMGATPQWEALAQVNTQVSGYWLGRQAALLVRRPRQLSVDAAGRWHSATGPCLEYPDGWGFYAWHGVRVPRHVITAPERLRSRDYLKEPNVEVRRVMQERMGKRVVQELGGRVLDRGPRGTLYQVSLSDDPEQVARYVLVQDASTARRYFLRVPPTIRTAAEAVAWSFGLSVEEYAPIQET